MIGRLNHVAIAVRDIGKATAIYRDTLGASVSQAVDQPDAAGDSAAATAPTSCAKSVMSRFTASVCSSISM